MLSSPNSSHFTFNMGSNLSFNDENSFSFDNLPENCDEEQLDLYIKKFISMVNKYENLYKM